MFVNSQFFLTQKVKKQCMNCNMIALFTTLQRKDIILLEKISYFCGGIPKIFFQAVLWHIAIGGIHTHRVSGAEILAQRWFRPHCTHIIIWKCSAVYCNLKQFHTPCDIAQITIMMKWWLKSTEMSAIPGTGLPRAVCAPKSDSKVSQFLGTSHNIVINHICNQKPLDLLLPALSSDWVDGDLDHGVTFVFGWISHNRWLSWEYPEASI